MSGKGKEPADPKIAAAKAAAAATEAGAGADANGTEKKKAAIRILLATPCYGGVATCGYMISVIETLSLLAKFGVEVNMFMPESESLITRGRNAACAVFLAGDYTHLLFIDSDIRFPPIAVLALLKSGHPICGIPYPIKQIDWANVHNRTEPGLDPIEAQRRCLKRYCLDLKNICGEQEAYMPEFDSQGFCKVDHLGTGFLMIQRDVLVSMSRMSRQYVNDVAGYDAHGPTVKNFFFDFFDTMIHPETRRYLSEDYSFCFKAQRQGFDIWARPGIEVTHSGKMEFFGDFWNTYKFKDPKTGEYMKLEVKRTSAFSDGVRRVLDGAEADVAAAEAGAATAAEAGAATAAEAGAALGADAESVANSDAETVAWSDAETGPESESAPDTLESIEAEMAAAAGSGSPDSGPASKKKKKKRKR